MEQNQNRALPAIGRGKLTFHAAFAAWLSLVLQDEASGDSSHPTFSANILEMLVGKGYWDLVSQAIDKIWGDWAPLGYGTGPASSVSWPKEGGNRLIFGWDGYWTSGRWIKFHLPEFPSDLVSEEDYNHWLYSQQIVVEWNSATGQSSTFISSTLEGVEEIEEKIGEEWCAYVAPEILPDPPHMGRGGRGCRKEVSAK